MRLRGWVDVAKREIARVDVDGVRGWGGIVL